MRKIKKILIIILIQVLLLPYGALAEGRDRSSDLPELLSPKIQIPINMFQIMYQKFFQPALNKAAVSAANARSFQEHEDVLYEFGSIVEKRDFSR